MASSTAHSNNYSTARKYGSHYLVSNRNFTTHPYLPKSRSAILQSITIALSYVARLILPIPMISFQSNAEFKIDQNNNLREASCEKSNDCIPDGVAECVTGFKNMADVYLYEDKCLVYKTNCIGQTSKCLPCDCRCTHLTSPSGAILMYKFVLMQSRYFKYLIHKLWRYLYFPYMFLKQLLFT